MQQLAVFLAGLFTVAALAGCLGSEPKERGDGEEPPAEVWEEGLLVQDLGPVTAKAAAGALSMIVAREPASVQLPQDALLFQDGKFSRPPQGGLELAANGTLNFLAPPGLTNLTILVEGEEIVVRTPYNGTSEFVSGWSAIHLEEVQAALFPNRQPGRPNYVAAQQYYKAWFERHGFAVTIEEFLNTATSAAGCTPRCPNTAANVVAYRKGTLTPERILAFGAHYDMVPNTKHAAFDDTSGVVEVLELARVFANVTTQHSLLFGLWGGEESGLVGSNVWAHSNPDKIALMTTYVNLDVSALAWPAPYVNPVPVFSSAGPDGPMAERVNAGVARAWTMAGFPEEMIQYRQVGRGQAPGQVGGGGGVDAQSDHTSFIAAGVPSTFLFTSNVSAVFAIFHSPRDTLENMTLLALDGTRPQDDPGALANWTAEQWALGRETLARSLGTFQWTSFYFVLQAELGDYNPRVR